MAHTVSIEADGRLAIKPLCHPGSSMHANYVRPGGVLELVCDGCGQLAGTFQHVRQPTGSDSRSVSHREG